jgi:predicted small secreted protein
MRPTLWTALAGAMVLAGAALSGCEREGPAERAGKDIDRATKDTGRAIERAGEDIQDAAKDAQR